MPALTGGYVSRPVRIGDTVHRTSGPHSDFVRRLLSHLEEVGWPHAPRYLGRDDQGRDVLSYLPGDTVPMLVSETALHALMIMVRELHDLTAGTELAGTAEVVCHNDLDPRNTVFRSGRPVALIDWDLAAPGDRLHDVAHVAWQFVPLGPAATDLEVVGRRLRLLVDAYRLDDVAPLIDGAQLISTVLWWQDRCWRGIEQAADDGDLAMQGLQAAGISEQVRAAYAWTHRHRGRLEALLR